MKKLFFVDREMCGGDSLPPDFDLEEFCEKLQGKVTDIEIVPANQVCGCSNRSTGFVSPHLIQEALGEYYPQ